MDMQLNQHIIRSERLKRAWSQEQLAQVAGLGVRTVQRVESGESASLETAKALAAVLELAVAELLLELSAERSANLAAEPTTKRTTVAPLPLWRRPLNRAGMVASAGAALLVVVLFGMVAPMVLARQVDIDMAVVLDDQQVSLNRLSSDNGSAAMMQIDKLLKINLTPTVTKNGAVFIHTEIFSYENGEYKLVAKPSVMIDNSKTSEIRMTTTSGSLLQLKLTPQIH